MKKYFKYSLLFLTMIIVEGFAQTITVNNIGYQCQRVSFNIPYTVTGSFNAGNTFIAELTDEFYNNPIQIGSISSTTSGVISAITPNNIDLYSLSNNRYRIRIKSTSPAVNSVYTGIMGFYFLPPTPPWTIYSFGGSTTITCNQSVNIGFCTNIPTPSATYQWYKDDVPIPGGTTVSSCGVTGGSIGNSINVNAAGTYKLVLTSSCGTYTSNSLIISGTLAITATSNTAICKGITQVMSATGAGSGGTYTWSPAVTFNQADGSIVQATPNTTTTYLVTGTSSNGCTGSTAVAITVNAAITAQPLSKTICAGQSVNFSVAVSSAGSGTISYQWYANNDSSPVGTNSSVLTVSGVTIGMTGYKYYCKVTQGGCTTTSSQATLTVIDDVTPGTPNPVPVMPICVPVSFSWTAVPGALSYQVKVINNGTIVKENFSIGNATSYSIPGTDLTPGATCSFSVRAVNSCGTPGAYSSSYNFITQSLPAPPSSPPLASDVLCSSFTASWGGVAGTGISYQLEVSTSSVFATIDFSFPVAGNSYQVTGLTPGKTYYYRVKTLKTISGCVTKSSAVEAQAPFTTLGAPPRPVAYAESNKQCTSFQANWANIGGTGITYVLEVSTTPDFTGIILTTNPIAATSYLVTGVITAGTTYYYRARSINACGLVSTNNPPSYTTVTTLANPVINTQPSPQNICSQTSAIFSITATGSGTLSYQWQEWRNSTGAWSNIASPSIAGEPQSYSGYNTNQLTINGIIYSMNANNYRCLVTTPGGCLTTSSQAALNLTGPPISAQPLNTNTCEGGNAGFAITATGTGITYQWQVSSGSGFVNLSNTAPYSNVTQPGLTITGATALALNNKMYRCIVSSAGCSSTSNTASLLIGAIPAGITLQPTSKTVCGGSLSSSTASFLVNATGSNLAFQWQVSSDGGASFTPLTIASPYSVVNTAGSSQLSVYNSNTSLNNYKYKCLITGACTSVESDDVTLNVNPTPGNPGTIGGYSNICPNRNNINYSVSPLANAATYVWTFPGTAGASIVAGNNTNNISVNFAADGTTSGPENLTVYGVSAFGCVGMSSAKPVDVDPLPGAAGPISGPAIVYPCGQYQYSVNNISNVTNSGYVWSFPPGTQIISGYNTKTITVKFNNPSPDPIQVNVSVYGANSCGSGASASLQVTVNNNNLSASIINAKNPTCSSQSNDGKATVNTSGGVLPVSYEWKQSFTPIAFSATATGLSAGTYQVTVTDAAGCSVVVPVTITNPVAMSINTNIASNTCFGSATVSDGTAPYRFDWNQITGTQTNTIFSESKSTNTSNASNLKAGTYQVTVTDANGCIRTSNNITVNAISPRTYSICFRWKRATEIVISDPPEVEWPLTEQNPAEAEAEEIGSAIGSAVSSCKQMEEGDLAVKMRDVCASVENVADELNLNYNISHGHFTLYYYDRAGNLVKTVAPKGVDLSSASRMVHPNHTFATTYEHNSLKQPVKQASPDGGQSRFLYDDKGQLRFSQNAKQAIDGTFSYTKYDLLGRTTEVGQSSLFGNSLTAFADLNAQLNVAAFPTASNTEQTYTVYNDAAAAITYAGSAQRNLENRVSYAYTAGGAYTYYSYDVHGNVEWLVQDIPGFSKNTIKYAYDLISNKITEVKYNEFRKDKFFHRYSYDEDNRITSVLTSSDGIIWENDCNYEYYLHGPLKRTNLGQDHIQGMDYTYTIHGWLKSINHPDIKGTNTPDTDGGITSTYAKDVFAMSLGYYSGDYENSNYNLTYSNAYAATNGSAQNLFNGNITTWTNNLNHGIASTGDAYDGKMLGQVFHYDRLNRLANSEFKKNFNATNTTWEASNTDYATSYTYDANGNILTLNRRGLGTSDNEFDKLVFTYQSAADNNRLGYVTDNSTSTLNGTVNDMTTQASGNYEYDAIGNLTKDAKEEIASIEWTIYGKVKKITRTATSTKADLEFMYDASGNRITKIVKPRTGGTASQPKDWITTHYVVDAAGNMMGIYERTNQTTADPTKYNAVYTLNEQAIYASSRVGAHSPGSFELARVLTNASDLQQVYLNLPSYTTLSENKHLLSATQKLIPVGGRNILKTQVKEITVGSNNVTTGNKLELEGVISNGLALAEDANGSPLFYVVATEQYLGTNDVCFIYDRNWNIMPGNGNIKASGKTKPVLTQNPANPWQYYIFTTDAANNLYYHTVDMSLPGNAAQPAGQAMGDIQTTQSNVAIGSNMGNNMALFEDARPGHNSILYTTRYNTSNQTTELVYYEISPSGITSAVVADELAGVPVADGRGELTLSPANNELAALTYSELPSGFSNCRPATIRRWTLDDNHKPTVQQAAIPLTYETAAGASIAYSHQSGYLYCSQALQNVRLLDGVSTSHKAIWQINTTTAAKTLFFTEYGNIRRGIDPLDKRMYIAPQGANELAYIEERLPNVFTTGTQPINDATAGADNTYLLNGSLSMQQHKLSTASITEGVYTRMPQNRKYEMVDHLGNVRALVSGRKGAKINGSIVQNFGEVLNYADYYPFGMSLRSYNPQESRFGFNGKEKVDEVNGVTGSTYDFGARLYDSRLGRWLSVDPLAIRRPDLTPFRFGLNSPISFNDPDGMFEYAPGLLQKYPKIKPALENLKADLQKPENVGRLNNILRVGQYGSTEEFFKLFDDNNKDVRIESFNSLSIDKSNNVIGNLAETNLRNERTDNDKSKFKGTIKFDESLLGAVENGAEDALGEIKELFDKTTEHEIVHYGDDQNLKKGDAVMQLNPDGSLMKEAGEIYEKITYGKVTGTSDVPKAEEAIKDAEKNPK